MTQQIHYPLEPSLLTGPKKEKVGFRSEFRVPFKDEELSFTYMSYLHKVIMLGDFMCFCCSYSNSSISCEWQLVDILHPTVTFN